MYFSSAAHGFLVIQYTICDDAHISVGTAVWKTYGQKPMGDTSGNITRNEGSIKVLVQRPMRLTIFKKVFINL